MRIQTKGLCGEPQEGSTPKKTPHTFYMKNNNTTAKNIFLAAGEPTLKLAQKLLRKLQRESGRETTESDFARLEKAWETDQLYM